MRVGILGAGSWGTALAILLGKKGENVLLWARRKEISEAINTKGENPFYLPGFPLPPNVKAMLHIEEAVQG
ncbi:MAG: 2-dehydropantoate 2-reductase N-terminal domain-containing protein, partial [bacterium]